MAVNKTIKTRVQLKSDTEEHWNLAGPRDGSAGFVPLLGELIVYLPDGAHPFCRLKVGNGSTNVVSLPFIDSGTVNGISQWINHYVDYNHFPPLGDSNLLYMDDTTNLMYYWNNRYINVRTLAEHDYDPTSSYPISGRGVADAIDSLDTTAAVNNDFSKTIYKLTVSEGNFGFLTRPISIGKSNFNQALQTEFDDKASLSGADFTGNVTLPTMEPYNDSTYAATTAFVQAAINRKIGMAAGAFVFQGILGDPTETPGAIISLPKGGYKKGDTYLVSEVGDYGAGQCEQGELVIAIQDGPTVELPEVEADHWIAVEHNIDNALYRSNHAAENALNGYVALFDSSAPGRTLVFPSTQTLRQLIVAAGGERPDTQYEASGYIQAYVGHRLPGTGLDKNKLVLGIDDGCLTLAGDISFTTDEAITGIVEVQV